MLKVGDVVFVEDSAQEDCTLAAWQYIDQHRRGTVVKIVSTEKATGKDVQCAVDFGAEFSGGHYCTAALPKHTGQFITAKHLSLCFEESRDAVTIPNIGGV